MMQRYKIIPWLASKWVEKHNQPTNYFYCLHLCSYKECRGPKTKILRSHFVRRKARRGMRLIIKSLRTGYGSRVLTSTDTLRADPQPLTSHSLAPLGLSVSLSSSPSLPPCARSVTPSRQPSCRVSQTQREPTSLADPFNALLVLLCDTLDLLNQSVGECLKFGDSKGK